MKFHPIADEQPLLSDSDFESLKEDIRKNGLLVPIVPDENGLLLDGRHRLRACKELGIPVWLSEPVSGTDEHKRAIADSLNYERRHLTESQRAFREAARVNVKHGSNQFAGKEDLSQDKSSSEKVSRLDAAKTAKTSPSLIDRATVVHKKGIKKLKDAVHAGTIEVGPAAKIAKPSHPEVARKSR